MAEADLIHWLVVGEDPDGEDAMRVEHDERCPVVEEELYEFGREEPVQTIRYWDCAVSFHELNAGLREYFLHSLDENAVPWREDVVAPGRHRIEAWSETYPGGPWGPTEHDGGLRLAEEA